MFNIFKMSELMLSHTSFLKTSYYNTHLLQRFAVIFLREEVNVSGGDDAHQLAAHLACLCDRNARETVSYFGLRHISNRVVWTHHNWVCDETLLKPLETKTNIPDMSYDWGQMRSEIVSHKLLELFICICMRYNQFTLTLRTSLAWNSGVQLWWMMPMPPIS